jgi:sugar-specific transcriptional regulator TrmB
MNGHEISKQAGVPASKVYETLDRLRGKGAVLVYESDPVRYAPVPYRDLLSTFSDRMTRTLELVSRSLAAVAMDTDARLTWSITGTGGVVEAVRGAIRHATQSISAVLDAPVAAELAPDLRDAAARGVRVEVVTSGPVDADLSGVGTVVENGTGGPTLVVGDGSETVIGALDGPGGPSGVWTHHPAMSLLARRHVEALSASGTNVSR